jgi:hypothetical protein
MVHIPQFGIFERSFRHSESYERPYTQLVGTAAFTGPDGLAREIPLFWDGERTWRVRFSPDQLGCWSWATRSDDPGLDGQGGTFEVVESGLKGSIRPMPGYPHHFERQNGERFWWLGDTQWSLYTDSQETAHDRAAAEHYIDVRAAQGFNVVHSMLMQEDGWTNAGGPPFTGPRLEALAGEQINPCYWREVDERLAYLNQQGIVGGLVLAWGRKKWKQEVEPWAWDRFAGLEARQRYARYVAARYSAYDVYLLVAGEWNASARGPDNEAVRLEYVQIGNALRAADPHKRMTGIHPGCHGNHFCREFNAAADWCDFGDYQQNYVQLNAEVVASRVYGKPVINSEYAYYLRDADEDGVVDKPNSQSLEITRHATWDLVMGGAYVVTGFGNTYMGGARCLGSFGVDAPQNDDWEAQIQHVPAFFERLAWWKLDPHNELLSAAEAPTEERTIHGRPAPPERAYWCLAEPGAQYVLYARGMASEVSLDLDAPAGDYAVWQYDPRTSICQALGVQQGITSFAYSPPDERDWVVVLEAG